MADQDKRLVSNVAGNFFVDATCINCDACRQLAPNSFEEIGGYSAVVRQPIDVQSVHQAYQALLACPVGSIGTEHTDKVRMSAARSSFPLLIEEDVYYCGFNSEKSFGANSFFVQHADGNWLIDSPRYVNDLIAAFEQRGGIRYIFLTHEDDVADAGKYAEHFGAKGLSMRLMPMPLPMRNGLSRGWSADKLPTGFRPFRSLGIPPAAWRCFIMRSFFLRAIIYGGIRSHGR